MNWDGGDRACRGRGQSGSSLRRRSGFPHAVRPASRLSPTLWIAGTAAKAPESLKVSLRPSGTGRAPIDPSRSCRQPTTKPGPAFQPCGLTDGKRPASSRPYMGTGRAASTHAVYPQSARRSLRLLHRISPQPFSPRPPVTTPAARLATYFHVHLVSDSTGETLNAMARAVCARFDNVLPIEHIYALVRSQRQLDRALGDIEEAPGIVLHTIVDDKLRQALEEGCRRMSMLCIPALDLLVSAMSRYLGYSTTTRGGAHLRLDNDYFNRMDALNYAIGHDDGQGGQDLEQADVILVGVSRTSKTPTCIYLAHRGVRAGNVPLVPGRPIPEKLFDLKTTLVVVLTISPDRLIQIRRNRLLSLKENRESTYIDVDAVRDEIVQARRLYERQGWPVIDVTRRSVEEPAAAVLNLLHGGHGQIEVLGGWPRSYWRPRA